MDRTTIFAPATAPGRAGIAVIRISGPAADQALTNLIRGDLPAPRRAIRAKFIDPDDETVLLDDGLALRFPAPASYTGEDVVELHVHGGLATVEAMLDALGRIAGLRLAEPGEFTRRAFDNGKLDLTEIEGLADLVAAETDAQRRQALRQLGGALHTIYDSWRETLLRVLAWVEADIDFPDEDLPPGLSQRARPEIEALIESISSHLADGRRGERLRGGVSIAILGPPNAGKSSLLNALAQRDAAIVAETAGTTRDVIEVHLDLGGYPVIVADTAGLRETADRIEDEGVRRALVRAEAADINIVMAEPGGDQATLAPLLDDRAVAVINKIDLAPSAVPRDLGDRPALGLSVRTGEGMAGLLEALTQRVAVIAALAPSAGPTRARHREALEETRAALRRALAAQQIELAAEDLRLAARAMGRLTGRVAVDDVLDRLFQEFCIGK